MSCQRLKERENLSTTVSLTMIIDSADDRLYRNFDLRCWAWVDSIAKSDLDPVS